MPHDPPSDRMVPMSHTEARQPKRTLTLGAPPVRPKETPREPAAAVAPVAPAFVETRPAPAPVRETIPPTRTVSLDPAPPAARTHATPRVASTEATSLVPVAAMYEELTKPLSELPRRSAADFRELFIDLVRQGVSDVHMTRSKLGNTFTVEARVDGTPQEVHVYEGVLGQTIHTLIKTDSEMSSGVNLVPEDGSYKLPIDGYPYRARAVVLPLFDGGERIVFRLPQIGELRPLDQLGFTPRNMEFTKDLLNLPGGMTLVAGPTGEGKSTTALSSLKYLREKESGVFISLEDPVERVIPGIAQIEVKEEIQGAGFGDMMKYIVRADPNVLFIGEIRDVKTATAAVEIAKSGIRVLATIHATNNISAMLRLMEMADAPPLSVLESLNGVISQRLVRRLVPGTDRLSGRYPIHEVTHNTSDLTDTLIRNVSRREIAAVAAHTSTSFAENVRELIAAGVTTRAEAQKVVSLD